MNTYMIVGPGFQTTVETSMDMKQYCEFLVQVMEKGETTEFQAQEGVRFIYKPAPGQHLALFTEKAWDRFRIEQQYAQAGKARIQQ